MKYTAHEETYIDKDTKQRATSGKITAINLNETQFNKIRDLVIELYNREQEQ